MAEAGLAPDELDFIEDALEELELDGAPEGWSRDELSPRVREHLADYRSILVAAREALPLEDVPTGLLDGVFEQARQVAAAAPAAATGAVVESWWSRVRRGFMVPALALAGTAVLVFWVFDPADAEHAELARTASSPEAETETVARLERAAGDRAEATPTAAPPAIEADEKEKDAPDEEEAPAEGVEDAIAVEGKLDDAKSPESKPTETGSGSDPQGRMGSLGEAPGVTAGSAGVGQKSSGGSAGPASGRWDIVSRGDRARQAGDCVAARDEYALALEDDEPRVRSRAFAGLGLCDAAAGDDVSADANYQRARELDDAVESFIDSQSQRSRGSGKKKRKTSSPKKNSKAATIDAFDDAADPFSP